MATKTTVPYENNPIMIGIEGLKLIFSQAKGVGIYSIVVTVAMFVVALMVYVVAFIIEVMQNGLEQGKVAADVYVGPSSFDPMAGLLFVTSIVAGALIFMAVSLLLFGVLEYAAAMTAKGKTVTLGESFTAVLQAFPAYLWMYMIFTVKVLLWSLLFIIPGIIMFNRYLLAGTVFFAEGKRGNAAIRRSAELTKGAWLTTYGGAWIWNIISQGMAAMVFWPGCMAILYRQLAAVTDADQPKPAAHILSWLTLLLPIALAMIYIMLIVLLFALTAVAPSAP